MGRPSSSSKKLKLFSPLFKVFFLAVLCFLIVYFVSYGLSSLSSLSLQDVYAKIAPVSDVAGVYIEKVDEKVDVISLDQFKTAQPSERAESPILKIGLLSDSHNENPNIEKALNMASERGVQYIFHLGDFTSVGGLQELKDAKKAMDTSSVPFYVIPGDHDITEYSNWKGNFETVFGSRSQLVMLGDFKFLLLDNSDNANGLTAKEMVWFKDNLENMKDNDKTFIILSNPLYATGLVSILMGNSDEDVKKQAEELLTLIQNSKAKVVFSGDAHEFRRTKDPVRDTLEHIGIGALTTQNNFDVLPNFEIVNFYSDNTYSVEKVVLQ